MVLVIAASAVLAAYEAVRRLADPQELDHLGLLALAGVIGFLGNELVARYRITVGREIGSAALVADGLHARTDGFTSLGVVLSAAAAWAGFARADAIIGLLITLAVLAVLRDAARDVYRRLMDAVDPALVDLVEAVARRHRGRARRRGRAAALDRAPAAGRARDRRRRPPERRRRRTASRRRPSTGCCTTCRGCTPRWCTPTRPGTCTTSPATTGSPVRRHRSTTRAESQTRAWCPQDRRVTVRSSR